MRVTERDIDTLARTIYGEARGETLKGKIAVAHVVLNRVKAKSWWGRTIHGVCRKPWQFSAWNANDPNRPRMERVTISDRLYRDCLYAAVGAIQGHLKDPTKGSCHYHTRAVAPRWSQGKRPVVTIGAHRFYNDIS